ncbi:MAG: low molecular weight phosphatase family protein [Geminicoccaceae bacterium]
MAKLIGELPGSVLFACTHNAVRSPTAEALMKYLHGRQVYVQSVGIRPEPVDPFAVAALDEIGIDIAGHRSRSFDDLEDEFFDLVISLSPEAQHRAVELTRTSSCEIELWPTMEPGLIGGSRETRLDAYRALRDDLLDKLQRRFPPAGSPAMV